jgi:hypothetical protein
VGYYRDRIGELRRFVEEHDVVTMPSGLGAIEIVETPAFLKPVSPGASMYSPLLFSKSATGYYFITPPRSLADAAARLDMNEDFDRDRIWSTAAHEAMPGHFFQLSIARRHPDFVRRIQYSDVFQEGWAYYGEEMFVRLGLYGDDLDPRLFTGARSAGDRRREACLRRMGLPAGGRFLRRGVGIHPRGIRGGRLEHRARPRERDLLHGGPPPARDPAWQIHGKDGGPRFPP